MSDEYGYDPADGDDPLHPLNCRHVQVVIDADDARQEATDVRCTYCGDFWPLDAAPAFLVARAVALMLGMVDEHAAVLGIIRDVPRVRAIEVVDLLAEAVELDRYRDAE